MNKKCSRCKAIKNLKEFDKNQRHCKNCVKYYNDKRVRYYIINCKYHGELHQTKYTKNYKKCKKCIYSKEIEKEFKNKFENFDKLIEVIIDKKEPIVFKCKKHGICKQTIKNIRSSPKSMGCKKCLIDLKKSKVKKREIKDDKIKCQKCKIYKLKKDYIKNKLSQCKQCYYKSSGYLNSRKKYHKSKKYIVRYKENLLNNKKNYYNIYYDYCKFCNKLFVYSNSLPKTNLCIKHRNKNNSPKERCRIFNTKYEIINKNEIFIRDKYICSYCNNKCVTNPKLSNSKRYITIDHIIPISKGGNHTIDNLTTACRSCNSKKSNKLLTKSIKNENTLEKDNES